MTTDTENLPALPCAVRWMEFNRRGELVTKEREFKTVLARERFMGKLDSKSSFHSIVAVTR